MEFPKNFKNLRKLGVRNIAQYSAANLPFPAFFSTDIHFFHTICHVYRSVWPAREAKPRFGSALVRSAHDSETRLLEFCKHQQKKAQHRESIPSPNTYQKSYHKEQFGSQDVPMCFRELIRVFVSDCRVSVKQIWPLTISTEPEEEIGKFERFSAKTYMLFTDREVRIEKNVAQGLECTDRGLQPRPPCIQDRGQSFFLIRTDQGR